MTKLTTWQATIQDDDTGAAVVEPVVTVRKGGAAGDLAELFDVAGSGIGNPVTGGTDGFVQFQTYPGRYWIQAADGGTFSQAWYWDAVPDEGLNWASRADLVTDWAAGIDLPDGAVLSDGTVQYVVSAGATAIADLLGLLPFGQRRPVHDGLSGTINIPSDIATMQEVIDRYGSDPVDDITISIEASHRPTSGISVEDGEYGRYTVSSATQPTAFLYLTGSVSISNGETITQAVSGASGTLVSATGSSQVLLLDVVSGTFDTTNELTGSVSGALGASSVPRVSRAGVVLVPEFSGNFIEGTNARLPVLDCLVAGPGTSALFDGYYVKHASIGKVTEGNGVVGAWSAGLRTFGSSIVEARSTIWDCGAQVGTTGASCNIWGGNAYLDDASAVWSGYYGIQAAHGGTVTARNSDASNAFRHGFRASDASILDGDSATASNCGRDGSGSNVRSFEGSKVSFVSGTANGGFNCFFCSGGELNIKGATGTGASSVDLIAASGVVYTDNSTTFTTKSVANSLVLGSTKGNFQWGTYTPVSSGKVNIATDTPGPCQFMRVGDTVTVSGTISISTSAAANTASEIELSLPIASDFVGFSNLAGSGAATTQQTTQTTPMGVLGSTTNDTAEFRFAAQTTNNVVWSFTFTYRIV